MSETTTAEPTVPQMRAWLRANARSTGIAVGRRGFLSADAVRAYREAHGLYTPEHGPAAV